MQVFFTDGRVKKVKLTTVESRRVSEAGSILKALNSVYPEMVTDCFIEKYESVQSKVMVMSGKSDDGQMEFPEEVYTATVPLCSSSDCT